jgi:hypothetical protein
MKKEEFIRLAMEAHRMSCLFLQGNLCMTGARETRPCDRGCPYMLDFERRLRDFCQPRIDFGE